jgi:hypothetical protein
MKKQSDVQPSKSRDLTVESVTQSVAVSPDGEEISRAPAAKTNWESKCFWFVNIFYCFFFLFVCRCKPLTDEDIYDVDPTDETERDNSVQDMY